MSTNLFVNNFNQKQEQSLMNELVSESIKMNGIDIIYSPRTLINEDLLLGEDSMSAFNDAFQIEAYIESSQEFGGEGDILTKFGFEIRDELNLIIHKERFQDVTGTDHPAEGDLIFFPLSKGIFEIKFVETENPFYSFGKLYTFDLKLELFQFSQETLNTGVKAIDDVGKNLDNPDSVINDPFAKNTIIQTEADKIIDFSEGNPWSDNF